MRGGQSLEFYCRRFDEDFNRTTYKHVALMKLLCSLNFLSPFLLHKKELKKLKELKELKEQEQGS
ncbi:hypothetical protein Csa_000348 [Cucumis sativus]|uniref:Uncharacterized protein n=1 Tax=Cucumis sativus TaxID=3659 RepID=A0A0A0KJK6_CUCSA|nr:hypothetical protein Csa_000348 [Cucumis sativus]